MTAKFLAVISVVMLALAADAEPTNRNASVPLVNLSAAPVRATNSAVTVNGTGLNARTLFLRNCAHCHGADARGDDGPDLHGLDLTRDAIASRIRKGKAGEMTAFANKLKPTEIDALVAYVLSLK